MVFLIRPVRNNSPNYSGTFNRTDVTPNVACIGTQNVYSRSNRYWSFRFSSSIFMDCANDALTDGDEVVFSLLRGRCRVPMVYYNVKL
jgi:hypothetical protein